MKYILIASTLSILFSCAPRAAKERFLFEFSDAYRSGGYVMFLSVKYLEASSHWPNSLQELKQFAYKNDTLRMMTDSISARFTFNFLPLSADSLQIKLYEQETSGTLLSLWVTPRSIAQSDSTRKKEIPIKFVDDTTSQK